MLTCRLASYLVFPNQPFLVVDSYLYSSSPKALPCLLLTANRKGVMLKHIHTQARACAHAHTGPNWTFFSCNILFSGNNGCLYMINLKPSCSLLSPTEERGREREGGGGTEGGREEKSRSLQDFCLSFF